MCAEVAPLKKKHNDSNACITETPKRMSITAALQWCFAGFSLGCRKAKNNIRVDKVLHQPGNSLVYYKSSEARVVPARQREESRSCGRNGNPSWHFSPFIKSSSSRAARMPLTVSPQIFRSDPEFFFFSTTQESENLFRSQTVGCSGESWGFLPPRARLCLSASSSGLKLCCSPAS